MATIQYVSFLFLSLVSSTAILNPKLSTYPIARKINLVALVEKGSNVKHISAGLYLSRHKCIH